jgi:hypothetical protein
MRHATATGWQGTSRHTVALAPPLAHLDIERFEARKRGGDILYYAVGKIVLLKIADHVLERQRGNGGFVG